MIRRILVISLILLSDLEIAHAAAIVPNEIQQPGTQPLEIQQLDPVSNCAQCHGGYDRAVEPYHNWIGSMMAHQKDGLRGVQRLQMDQDCCLGMIMVLNVTSAIE